MPTTFPAASSSGPPEFPGLIAASVWMRFVSDWLPSVEDRAALGRHDAARDRVRICPERAADRDDELADLERIGLADRGGRQPRGVDLDDRQVGEAVDAVDRARQHPAVLELDVELGPTLDDVMVGEDPAVRVEDDARADARLRDDAVAGVGGARDLDLHDRGADLRGDRDRRRLLVDGDGLDGRARSTPGRPRAQRSVPAGRARRWR